MVGAAGSFSTSTLRLMEIACDESGYEGEKLIGSTTRLFAHASVRVPDAADVLASLRERIRSPATEYKANHLLRSKHHAVLTWFLGTSGPVHGRGHVFLLDKSDFVRAAFVREFGFAPPDLAFANDVLRVRNALPVPPFAAGFRARLLSDPIGQSVLDPLVPALVAAVSHWGGLLGGPISVAHDRQTQLPPRRIEVIRERCALGEIRFLDALSHPEIQIADILAGTVRAITESGDRSLLPLLPAYLSP
jgi:hypothetical protein